MRWLQATLAIAACFCAVAGEARSWSDYEVYANNELNPPPGPADPRQPSRHLQPSGPSAHSNEVPGSFPWRNASQSAAAAWHPEGHVALNEVPDVGSRSPYDVPRPNVAEAGRRNPNDRRRNPGNGARRDPNEVARRDPNQVDRRDPNQVDRRDPNRIRQRNPNEVDRRNPNEVDRRNPNEVDRRDPNRIRQRNPNEAGRRNPNEIGRRSPNEIDRRSPNEIGGRNPTDAGQRGPNDVTGKRKGRKGMGRKGNGTRGMDGTRYFCPASFVRNGNSCYFLSTQMATWQDAHFHCKDLNAELARMEQRWEDRNMRLYLSRPELAPLERWIGGIYDWELKQWVWGASANVLGYQGFSRRRANVDHRWHCIAMNPSLLFRWSARSCLERRHFLCETPLGEIPGQLRRRRKDKLARQQANDRARKQTQPGGN